METNINVRPWVWTWLGILLIGFLAISILGKIPEVRQAFKSDVPKNTISMSAEGKVSAVPDLASMTLGVLTTASTAQKAQQDNTAKINAVIDYVKKQGIEAKDITTTQLSIYPQYEYTNGKNTITGYQANQSITVKVRGIDKSTDQVGKILDGSTAAGVNEIQGVYMTFDDPDNLRQDARKIAIEKAKQKAQELADQAGLRLGKIVSISEGSSYYPGPVPYAMDQSLAREGMGMGGGGNAKVEPGSQDITASITVVFEVK